MERALVITDLRSVGDVFSAVADETDGLHAGVGERSIAGELRQTFDSVLEGVNGCWEMLLKYIRCEVKRDDRGLLQNSIFIQIKMNLNVNNANLPFQSIKANCHGNGDDHDHINI